MALPMMPYDRIPSSVRFAARLDHFLLASRRPDDSYGSSNDDDVRIVLSLAVLQCHVDKGLTRDSPRLLGTYEWIRSQTWDSSKYVLPPLRLAAAAAVHSPTEDIQQDLVGCIHVLSGLNSQQQVEKPVLVLLCIDAVAAFAEEDTNLGPEVKQCVLRMEEVLSSMSESPAVRSYAASILYRYGSNEQKELAVKASRKLLKESRQGGWSECLVDTAYVTINIAELRADIPEIGRAVGEAVMFMQKNCPNGIPDYEYIRKVPKELGNNPKDLQTYAAAIVIRALLRGIGELDMSRLQFAHAAWSLQVENHEREYGILRQRHRSLWTCSAFCGLIALVAFMGIALSNLNSIGNILTVIGAIASILAIVPYANAKIRPWPK